jgi:hypothetical protein
MVASVRDEEASGSINSHAFRTIQFRISGWTAIAAKSANATAGNGRDDSCLGVNASDTIVVLIGNE